MFSAPTFQDKDRKEDDDDDDDDDKGDDEERRRKKKTRTVFSRSQVRGGVGPGREAWMGGGDGPPLGPLSAVPGGAGPCEA